MKKVCTSMMVILFSLLVLQLAGGVVISRCLHTGKLHIVSMSEMAVKSHAAMQTDEDCGSMSGTQMEQKRCMEYSVEQLSPSVQAPVFHYDFAAVQPLLLTICSFVEPTAIGAVLPQDVFCPDKVPIPPRAYLAHIRVLII